MAGHSRTPKTTIDTGMAHLDGTAEFGTPYGRHEMHTGTAKSATRTTFTAIHAATLAILGAVLGAAIGYRVGLHHGLDDGWWRCAAELGAVG